MSRGISGGQLNLLIARNRGRICYSIQKQKMTNLFILKKIMANYE